MAKATTVTKITTTPRARVSATTIILEWRQVCVAGFILIVLLFCWLDFEMFLKLFTLCVCVSL